MVLRQRVYDIDDLWELSHRDVMDPRHYELIDGELIVMSPPGGRHGQLQVRLSRYLDIFAEVQSLGLVTSGAGYHPPDNRHTLLSPDMAFVSRARATTFSREICAADARSGGRDRLTEQHQKRSEQEDPDLLVKWFTAGLDCAAPSSARRSIPPRRETGHNAQNGQRKREFVWRRCPAWIQTRLAAPVFSLN